MILRDFFFFSSLCQSTSPENSEGQFLGKASCFLPETCFLASFPDDLCLKRKEVPMGAWFMCLRWNRYCNFLRTGTLLYDKQILMSPCLWFRDQWEWITEVTMAGLAHCLTWDLFVPACPPRYASLESWKLHLTDSFSVRCASDLPSPNGHTHRKFGRRKRARDGGCVHEILPSRTEAVWFWGWWMQRQPVSSAFPNCRRGSHYNQIL